MKTRRLFHTFGALALAAVLCACAAPSPETREPKPASAQATPTLQATPTTDAAASNAASPSPSGAAAAPVVKPPPPPADVRAALMRIYKDALTFDERAPLAAVGDFNGDGSEDLMAEARPAPGRVAELNDELSNWIVTDPHTVRPPDPREFDPHQGVQKLKPRAETPRVGPGDALLVVIHGHGEAGWRNPDALQTYLLKNVAGTELRAEGRAAARASAREGAPRLLGDVLHERLGGEQGFLYWTGANYGWFK